MAKRLTREERVHRAALEAEARKLLALHDLPAWGAEVALVVAGLERGDSLATVHVFLNKQRQNWAGAGVVVPQVDPLTGQRIVIGGSRA